MIEIVVNFAQKSSANPLPKFSIRVRKNIKNWSVSKGIQAEIWSFYCKYTFVNSEEACKNTQKI